MKKAISIAVLLILLTSCFSVSAAAAVPLGIQPLWENTSVVTGTMTFPEEGTGIAEMRVIGKLNVNKIEGSVVVYQVIGDNLIYITEDSKTATIRSCGLEIPFPAEHGAEYRADFKFVVYNTAGVGEVIERTITKTCP